MSRIYSPAHIAQNVVQFAKDRADLVAKGGGVKWPGEMSETSRINGFDVPNVFPMFGGDLCVLSARPGGGKTLGCIHLACQEARNIAARKTDECVIYIPYEGSVESIDIKVQANTRTFDANMVSLGVEDVSKVEMASVKRARLPLYYVGVSYTKRRENISPLFIDEVWESILLIRDEYGVTPTLIVLDYIQIIPVENEKNRIQQVTEASRKSKELAVAAHVPFLVAAQAGRQVDDYKIPIPRLGDLQHTSSIEQEADKVFGMCIPSKTIDPDETPSLSIGGKVIKNTPNTVVIRKIKERDNVGWGVYSLTADFASYSLS